MLGGATACVGAPEVTVPEVEAKLEAVTTNVTSSSIVVAVCSEVQSISTAWDATLPAFVAPGETFDVAWTVRLMPPILTPYAGVFDGQATLAVANATPSAPTVALAATFGANSVVSQIGSSTLTFTAPHCVGAPVQIRLSQIDYTIMFQGRPNLEAHCAPPAESPSVVATIPVVDEPETAADCKNGGYGKHTDLAGATFKSQGACIKYVING